MNPTDAMRWILCLCQPFLRLSHAKTLRDLVVAGLTLDRASFAELGRRLFPEVVEFQLPGTGLQLLHHRAVHAGPNPNPTETTHVQPPKKCPPPKVGMSQLPGGTTAPDLETPGSPTCGGIVAGAVCAGLDLVSAAGERATDVDNPTVVCHQRNAQLSGCSVGSATNALASENNFNVRLSIRTTSKSYTLHEPLVRSGITFTKICESPQNVYQGNRNSCFDHGDGRCSCCISPIGSR